MISSRRGGYKAELETDFIDTTDMCLELFFWAIASANSLYKPEISLITVAENKTALTHARSTGYELETWNRLFAKLPSGVHKVMVRGRRSMYEESGMSVDDIVVQPCVNFGKKNSECLNITQDFVLCNILVNLPN